MTNMEDKAKEFIKRERSPSKEPEIRITGLMIQYYHVCRRELWFMSRGVDIDRETRNIQRGTHVDETSYQNLSRSFMIGNRIQLDVLDSGKIMEVKVSSTLEYPAKMQLLFYLWYLREVYDIEKEGVLAYPTEKKREEVALTNKTIGEVEETVRGIHDVVGREEPPELEKKPYCDSCLYQDICWM